MNTFTAFSKRGVALVSFMFGVATATADIGVQISVKFIHNSDGTQPGGGIGTTTGFASEVNYGNQLLTATGRGFQLSVVEYLDIQPPAPAGQASSYWFTLPARSNRATIEAAALADTATWRWNPNAINIYVNNSSSGQCSFVGGGSSIALGATVATGTLVHEVGHIFNLKHTHSGDTTNNTNPANGVFTLADLQDGDGLLETAIDNPNIANHDQLSQALFGHVYASATVAEQSSVDSAFQNVMSYHTEVVFLSVQMDIWTDTANGPRLGFCNGRTWYITDGGSDDPGLFHFNRGSASNIPLATISTALSKVSSVNDVLLLGGGNYSSPANGTMAIPCTLRAKDNVVVTMTNP